MEQLFVDSNCIEYMIQEFSDMLVRIAYQNFNNPSDAEDIAQEVFLKCIKANVTFKDHQHMKAWLIRVTINQCKDHNKSAWFQKNTHALLITELETKKNIDNIQLKRDWNDTEDIECFDFGLL